MSLNSEFFCPNKMEDFWILTLISLLAINSLDKAESVQFEELEELPLQTFDELFVDEWLDKNEAEDLKTPAPTNSGQNVHHQIDRQNTQLGQNEPNSTDQNPSLPESDHSGQIEPNSTEQMKKITANENNAEEKRKRKIVDNFLAIKDEFKQKGKYSDKERVQIEEKISKHLKVNRTKIYKWKKELGLSRKMHNFGKKKNDRNNLIEKFDQRKAELTRAGFKNSYHNEIEKTVAKELGLSLATIYNWKSELGQTAPKHKHSDSEQKKLMKHYYEIKGKNPKIRDAEIAKMFKIGSATLDRWKRQFKLQQFHPNSIGGLSVEENAAANVQLGKELFE